MTTPDRIISASRRTDLPGFHADECAARLSRLRKPVHSVFFWTRHPRRLCDDGRLAWMVREEIENPLVQLTVTGLGAGTLEPRAPSTARVLETLPRLITALGGEPRRIIWRYDPVILEAMKPADFEALAGPMADLGIRRCVISFPALMSLKGSLAPAYEAHGLRRHPRERKREAALRLADIAASQGITLAACCQPKLVADCGGGLTEAACIDPALAAALHPRRLPLDLPEDPSQRRHCHCAQSHDIGKYSDRCGSGCVYCYSKASDAQN